MHILINLVWKYSLFVIYLQDFFPFFLLFPVNEN